MLSQTIHLISILVVAEAQQNSKAIMLEDDNAGIRKDIGLGHGDKIHVDDKDNGESSVLAKLYEQVCSYDSLDPTARENT